MADPKISVLMPVYNAAAYLDEAIRSIQSQTCADFELIAIDDGSTDHSLDMLRRHAQRDSRLRIVAQPNGGICTALNEGLKLARAPVIARMDADDVSMPLRFERQLAYLEAHPQCVAVGSWITIIDRLGAPLKDHQPPVDHETIDAAFLQGQGGVIPHPTAMIRTDALRSVGGYREQYRLAEDMDLFLRLAEVGELANLAQPLLRYRQHIANSSFVHHAQQQQCVQAVLADARRRRGLPPAKSPLAAVPPLTLVQRFTSWALHAIQRGNFHAARAHAWQLLRHAPLSMQTWRIVYWSVRG